MFELAIRKYCGLLSSEFKFHLAGSMRAACVIVVVACRLERSVGSAFEARVVW